MFNNVRKKAGTLSTYARATVQYYRISGPIPPALLLLETLFPFLGRAVTILILFSAFRLYVDNIQTSGVSEPFIQLAAPILFGIAVYLTLPPLTGAAIFFLRRRLPKRLRSAGLNKIATEFGIPTNLFRSHINNHRRIASYVIAAPFVYLALYIFADYAALSFIISEIIFWGGLSIISSIPLHRRLSHKTLQIDSLFYLSFALYLLLIAIFLYFGKSEFSPEMLVIVILLPRVQSRNMRGAARALLSHKI